MRPLLSTVRSAGLLTLLLTLVATASLAAGGSASAAPAPATGAVAPAARVQAYAAAASFDNDVLAWTNYYRKRYGRKPLRLSACQTGYATRHAGYMAAWDVMRHQSLTNVMRGCWWLNGAAENIAWTSGGMTGKQVVQMWMRSPGHKANILNRGYRYLGSGGYRSADTGRTYAAQVFGR